MIKKTIITTIAALTLITPLLTGCDNETSNASTTKTEKTQEIPTKYSSPLKFISGNAHYRIYCDTTNGVMYISGSQPFKSGYTVMLNKDGSPRIYEKCK